jgi:hypothetical protein
MRKPSLVLKVFLISSLVFSPLACLAAAKEESVNYAIATIDNIIFWLAIAPEICNLILVLLSLYLMLEGVRRWGTNSSGAFSRSLIGLFILHTTNLEISFLPYLALFLEIWLCARGFEARIKLRMKEDREKAEAIRAAAYSDEENSRTWEVQTALALKLGDTISSGEEALQSGGLKEPLDEQTTRALKIGDENLAPSRWR